MISDSEAEYIDHVEVKMCNHNAALVFAWGELPSHEYLIREVLDELRADAITNAQLSFTALPLLLYNRQCARVSGDVVRLNPGRSSGQTHAVSPQAEVMTPELDEAVEVEGGAQP